MNAAQFEKFLSAVRHLIPNKHLCKKRSDQLKKNITKLENDIQRLSDRIHRLETKGEIE